MALAMSNLTTPDPTMRYYVIALDDGFVRRRWRPKGSNPERGEAPAGLSASTSGLSKLS